LLSSENIQDHVKYALDGEIERLTARTGCGLLYDMSQISQGDRLYMGLEGHTEAESNEAMDPDNIGIANKTLQHRHDLKGTFPDDNPPFHDADFRHYQWQIHTVAPLYFEVTYTPFHTHIEFIQPIPGPTKMLLHSDQVHPFRCIQGKDLVYLIYPYDPVSISKPAPGILGTYQKIFDECLRIYYLYCKSITRVDAMEKMYSRYGIFKK